MVTIIGGGIAGTPLAAALAAGGHRVTLYERQPAGRGGQFLVLDGRGHRALAELGAPLDRLHAVSHPLTGLRIAYAGTSERTRETTEHRLYFRSDLVRVLTEFASGTTARLEYDTPVTDIDPETGVFYSGVTALDTDELIIGADGTDSLTRARLEPDRIAEYAGQAVIYGTTDTPVRFDTAPSVLHFNGRLGDDMWPASTVGHFWNDEVTVWFIRITQPRVPAGALGDHPVAAWAETIRATAPDLAHLVEPLLDATETVHVVNARNVPLDTARAPSEPIVLCGDADHAITPAAGVGARDAAEDAHAIWQAIMTGASPAAAMAARRARVLAERGAQADYARARAAERSAARS